MPSTIPSPAPRPNLTFGVEIEFLLVRSPWDPHELGQTAPATIRDALRSETPFSVYGEGDPDRPEYSRWTVDDDATVRLTTGEMMHLPKHKGRCYIAESVELKSPVYSLFDDGWRHEITQVLGFIYKKFNDPKSGMDLRLLVNQNCGLHVHVGKSKTRYKFSVRAMKNLYKLVTAFERSIDEVHTADRVGGAAIMAWAVPPGMEFRDMRDRYECVELHPLDWCDYIEESVLTTTDLELMHLGTRQVAYNFCQMGMTGAQHERRKLQTVEFRQHQGTLDAAEIIAWVEFVTTLVGFSESSSGHAVSELVRDHVEDASFQFADLLDVIGAEHQLKSYYQAKLSKPACAYQEELSYRLEGERRSRAWSNLIVMNGDENNDRRDARRRLEARRLKLANGDYGLFNAEFLQRMKDRFDQLGRELH